ncbi:MAG: hypothetical protein HGA67_03035 [Candidatus Yonathbacteria bacterium]|nr:hypothetical protein [Candidatus Yonathbacteria bacterium]
MKKKIEVFTTETILSILKEHGWTYSNPLESDQKSENPPDKIIVSVSAYSKPTTGQLSGFTGMEITLRQKDCDSTTLQPLIPCFSMISSIEATGPRGKSKKYSAVSLENFRNILRAFSKKNLSKKILRLS